MREIKFRAFFDNKLLEVSTIDFVNNEMDFDLGSLGMFSISLDDVVIEQYTGIKDKNGKEIYEGDVVHIDFNRCGIEKCEVKWHDEMGSWYFDDYNMNHFLTDSDFTNAHIEVIGNIHEGVKK